MKLISIYGISAIEITLLLNGFAISEQPSIDFGDSKSIFR